MYVTVINGTQVGRGKVVNQIDRQRDRQMPICPSAHSTHSPGKKYCTKFII